MRGFAGVNNHNVALLYDPIVGPTPFGSTGAKTGCSFFTHVSHLMVMIQGNSGRNMI